MNWDALWNAWNAVATTALVAATLLLALVGWLAVRWARRRFGQTEEMEAWRRAPLVALSLAAPDNPQRYSPALNEGQLGSFLKWWGVVAERKLDPYVTPNSIVACWAQNIGEGPALRIRVPYVLQVIDVIEGGVETKDEPVRGEFEIVNVDSKWLVMAKTYLNVSYYPKCRIELLLADAKVFRLDGTEVQDAVSDTSVPVLEVNNKASWDLVRQARRGGPDWTAGPRA
jgi:hypothetical protein